MKAYKVTYQITKVVSMTIFAESDELAQKIAETDAAIEDAYEYASYQSPTPQVVRIQETYFPNDNPTFNDRT